MTRKLLEDLGLSKEQVDSIMKLKMQNLHPLLKSRIYRQRLTD